MHGAELAAQHVYDKYIKDLSISIIKSSGRVILYFLHFLKGEGTNLYVLTHQDMGKFVDCEQERGQKTQSIVNYLRILYAFITYLVEQDILPTAILDRKIRLKLPEPLPRFITIEDLQCILCVIGSDRDRALMALRMPKPQPRHPK
ncbi:hypothetical protein [Desulforhopalus sp. 52FAK]